LKLINLFKGFFIGLALVVPGLSGSLLAIAMGIYDKILEAVTSLRKEKRRSILYLTPIGIGAVIGILASVRLILWLVEQFPGQAFSFFIGLALGAAPIVINKIRGQKIKISYLICSVVCFFAILFVSFTFTDMSDVQATSSVAIEQINSFEDFFMVFFAGIFSFSLMIIPGISGSVMLMSINQYGTVYSAVSRAADGLMRLVLLDFAGFTESLDALPIVLTFAIGGIIGIGFIAKILQHLLTRYQTITYYGVSGLIAGTIVTISLNIFNAIDLQAPPTQLISFILICLSLLIGGYVITRFINTKES